MLNVAPEVSQAWTDAERLAVIRWISQITLDRIERDDPLVPVLAKQQVRELFRVVKFLTVEPRHVLEQYRDVLLKPYDAARDFNGVEVPLGVLDALKGAPPATGGRGDG